MNTTLIKQSEVSLCHFWQIQSKYLFKEFSR